MRLLTICPSRNRPELCKRMLDSFDITKGEGTDIIVYVATDDPQIEKYKELLANRLHIFAERRHLVKVLNYVSCEVYPGIEYYQEINDDHIYRTPNWDRLFIEAIKQCGQGWGIACGNDLMTNEPWEVARHPSGAFISGNIVRVLGCFVLPELDHLFTDTYLRDIAEGINSLFHCTEVIIEHCHWVSGKAERNEANYNWVYASDNYLKAAQIYRRWVRQQRKIAIDKLIRARKEAICRK